MNKTVRMVPTLFVVAILGVGAWILLPSLQKTLDPDDGSVTVLVEFEPTRRSGKPPPGRSLKDQVTIQLMVGAQPYPTERSTRSPWERTLYPRKGEVVEVYAEQFYGTTLYCMVRQGSHLPVQDRKNGPSFVRCRHTVV